MHRRKCTLYNILAEGTFPKFMLVAEQISWLHGNIHVVQSCGGEAQIQLREHSEPSCSQNMGLILKTTRALQ